MYFLLVLAMIFVVLLPVIIIYYFINKLIDVIVPDLQSTEKGGKGNLISFFAFIAVNTPLYIIFGYIMAQYIMFIPEISYTFR
jgi:hypothetical protein